MKEVVSVNPPPPQPQLIRAKQPGYLDLTAEQIDRLISKDPIDKLYDVESEPFASVHLTSHCVRPWQGRCCAHSCWRTTPRRGRPPPPTPFDPPDRRRHSNYSRIAYYFLPTLLVAVGGRDMYDGMPSVVRQKKGEKKTGYYNDFVSPSSNPPPIIASRIRS
ncbi:hypothetical protein QTP88_004728 [Uroleucon formosanum]